MEEVIIIVGTAVCYKAGKYIKCKICKRKLRKLLEKGFEKLDFDLIKKAIVKLIDYDSKNKSKKLDKYMLKIVNDFRDDPEKLNINEKIMKKATKDFSLLENIFDINEAEEKEQMDYVDEKLLAIEKKRQDIIRRKSEIRSKLIAKEKKLNRRKINSAMG